VFHQDVAAILRARYGVISRRSALDAGMSDRQIQRLVDSGEWIRLHRGVYRHAVAPVTWHGHMLAACLASGGLASHRAAAYLHRLEGFGPGRRDITVGRRGWRTIEGVQVHQSTQMDRARPCEVGGVPCTGLARTVLDVAHVVSYRRLEDAVDALVREGRLEWADLYSVLAVHARRGRNGVGSLRRLLDARGGDEQVPLSSWSRMVADLLVANGLPEPRLEHRVLVGDGSLVAQVDLAYPLQQVAIELDSVRWHLNRDSFQRDRSRWNALTTLGWTVLAFTWQDYADRPLQLVGQVRSALTRN
jgi:hypothetical protein